jgi:uncharacterized protein YkwD
LTRLRRLITVGAIAGALATAAPPPGATALPHHSAAVPVRAFDTKLLSLINHKRSAKHLPAYTMNPTLWKIAHKWAGHLAAKQQLSHNPRLTTEVHNQCGGRPAPAENVTFATGSEVHPATILAEHLSDAPHRRNIYSATYRVVGVASVKGKYHGQNAEYNVIDFARSC